jgi:large subunit ribosomal protein L19
MDVREFIKPKMNPNIPQISIGDTVKVGLKTMEGDKERLQQFQGVVIKMRKSVDGGNFTVRRVSYGIGVERTFPFQSPSVQNVEVLRHGKVRRAKLYYMRRLSAKRARLKERREKAIDQAMHRQQAEVEAEEVTEEEAKEAATVEEETEEEAEEEEATAVEKEQTSE